MELIALVALAAAILVGAYPIALFGMSLAYRMASASAVHRLSGSESKRNLPVLAESDTMAGADSA